VGLVLHDLDLQIKSYRISKYFPFKKLHQLGNGPTGTHGVLSESTRQGRVYQICLHDVHNSMGRTNAIISHNVTADFG